MGQAPSLPRKFFGRGNEIMSKQRIFLALADEHLREKYRTKLFQEGFAIAAASDGLECIETLRIWTPELLVLDADLPRGGGDGVLAVMNRDPNLVFIPTIVLVPNSRSDRLERILRFPIREMVFARLTPEQLALNVKSILPEAKAASGLATERSHGMALI